MVGLCFREIVCLSTDVVSPTAEAIAETEDGRLAARNFVAVYSHLTVSPSWVDLEQFGDNVSIEVAPVEEKSHQINDNAANEL